MCKQFITLIVLVVGIRQSFAATVSQTDALLTSLFTGYNNNLRPVADHTRSLNVSVELYPRAIRLFDEVLETFSYAAALSISWVDYRLAWEPNTHGGLVQLAVPVTNLWTPEVFLATPATRFMYIIEDWNKSRIGSDGVVYFLQPAVIETTCSLNVKNYPFDIQSCDTIFMSLAYKSNEVTLIKERDGINLSVYTENALWDISSHKVYVENLPTGLETQMHFIFNLRRKSTYMVLNVLIPIFTLSLLNTMVFLLEPESGERVGYCITTLLAIAVYMTIIMDTLPPSSTPVPMISYKLVNDLIFSALITVAVILNIRILHMPQKRRVPQWLAKLYNVCTCKRCLKRSVVPGKGELNEDHREKTENKENLGSVTDGETNTAIGRENGDKDNHPTWKDISTLIDVSCFIFFVSASVLSFAIFVGLAFNQ